MQASGLQCLLSHKGAPFKAQKYEILMRNIMEPESREDQLEDVELD